MAVQTSGCPEYKIKSLARRQTVKPAAASTKICRNNYAIFCEKKNKVGKNDLIKVSWKILQLGTSWLQNKKVHKLKNNVHKAVY